MLDIAQTFNLEGFRKDSGQAFNLEFSFNLANGLTCLKANRVDDEFDGLCFSKVKRMLTSDWIINSNREAIVLFRITRCDGLNLETNVGGLISQLLINLLTVELERCISDCDLLKTCVHVIQVVQVVVAILATTSITSDFVVTKQIDELT